MQSLTNYQDHGKSLKRKRIPNAAEVLGKIYDSMVRIRTQHQLAAPTQSLQFSLTRLHLFYAPVCQKFEQDVAKSKRIGRKRRYCKL